MKSTKLLLLFGVTLLLFSCAKDQTELNQNSIVNQDGQISKNLANDPLFKIFDKANYEISQDLVNYSGEQIDRVKNEQLNKDARNHKFKNFKEFALAKEKIGYRDYNKRTRNHLYAIKTRNDLYNKYPELKSISSRKFFDFYYSNRNYKISQAGFNTYLAKIKEERRQRSLE